MILQGTYFMIFNFWRKKVNDMMNEKQLPNLMDVHSYTTTSPDEKWLAQVHGYSPFCTYNGTFHYVKKKSLVFAAAIESQEFTFTLPVYLRLYLSIFVHRREKLNYFLKKFPLIQFHSHDFQHSSASRKMRKLCSFY